MQRGDAAGDTAGVQGTLADGPGCEAPHTYRVITPYDARRNVLERKLTDAGLPWENKYFNVDPFQGNEEEYILISIVRSDRLGFLANLRRTDAMLSRCKRSMVICTSLAFMEGKARSSLVGQLAK
ncbi:uncharacterized protein B0H18DRAFT_1119164 [Fomitopsis serialis]|uniref:uncharacterized protein n=1 Tax=Fomitopsis serialis TaxID=139415 RepID=UPI0020084D04|nr:uncharacterized protein B0H18DRAFT_1119164 [Neoantrodia serialis]KAH9926004.1 hypothetical protein B0H18DRAFT_1119164 [Neoantrodia serialis]